MAMTAVFSFFSGTAFGDEKYTISDRFTLRKDGILVAIDPAAAFTIRQVLIEEKELLVTIGFGGFTMAYPGMQWVGSGHAEGGIEKVEEVKLEVDGQEVALPLGKGVEVSSVAILSKISHLRKDVTLRSEIRFEGSKLKETVTAEYHHPEAIDYGYAFMYCWSPLTEQWKAETIDGERLEGVFESNGSWHLERDVRWASVFAPVQGMGAVVFFDENNPPGQGRKSAFWDLERYHKQYFQFIQHNKLPVGTTQTWSSTLHFINALDEAEWQENIERISASQSSLNP